MQLQDALWHHPASQPILKHGNKRLDTTSFSDLVEERYIDSFVIDICISKFLEESKQSGNKTKFTFQQSPMIGCAQMTSSSNSIS